MGRTGSYGTNWSMAPISPMGPYSIPSLPTRATRFNVLLWMRLASFDLMVRNGSSSAGDAAARRHARHGRSAAGRAGFRAADRTRPAGVIAEITAALRPKASNGRRWRRCLHEPEVADVDRTAGVDPRHGSPAKAISCWPSAAARPSTWRRPPRQWPPTAKGPASRTTWRASGRDLTIPPAAARAGHADHRRHRRRGDEECRHFVLRSAIQEKPPRRSADAADCTGGSRADRDRVRPR